MYIEISLTVLKAVNEFASKEETRYYLNGVYVQSTDEGLTYVATDGHTLLAHNHEVNGEWRGELIIPKDVIKNLKPGRGVETGILDDKGNGKFSIQFDSQEIGFQAIDGTFPDWRRVLPTESSGESAQFNGLYLAKYEKVAKLLGGSPVIHHNGLGSALVTFKDLHDTVGAIMPIKKPREFPDATQWWNQSTTDDDKVDDESDTMAEAIKDGEENQIGNREKIAESAKHSKTPQIDAPAGSSPMGYNYGAKINTA